MENTQIGKQGAGYENEEFGCRGRKEEDEEEGEGRKEGFIRFLFSLSQVF